MNRSLSLARVLVALLALAAGTLAIPPGADGAPDQTGTLTGRVTDGDAGAPGVEIDLFEAMADGSRGTFLAKATTDTDGRFRHETTAGCYVLTFIAPDGRTFTGGRQWHQPSACVQAGETISGLDIAQTASLLRPVEIAGPPVLVGTDGFQHGPAGGPTENVYRDGATSVALDDGRILMLYGDTASLPGADDFFFTTSTAVLTPAWRPDVTEERLVGGRPTTLLPWTEGERAEFEPGRSYIGVWPAGGAWVPSGVPGGGRVVIAYHRYRVDVGGDYIFLGQGVAEYNYTDAETALAEGIEATRLNDNLFPSDDVAMSSPTWAGGWLYFYGCSVQGIQCYAARVQPANVAEPGRWQWWDGTDFAASRAGRVALAGVDEFSIPDVHWIPAHGAYAMVHGRGGDEAVIRWATNPAGPWSDPQIVGPLPGCGPTLYEGGCYGQAIRPDSTRENLVLTYAAYLTASNELTAVRTRAVLVPVSLAD